MQTSTLFRAATAAAMLSVVAGCGQPAGSVATPVDASAAISAAVASPQRSDADRDRDRYRHPVDTLAFFGIRPAMQVVEIWPGGGWYSRVLAPLLTTPLIAAHFPVTAAPGSDQRRAAYFARSRAAYAEQVANPGSPLAGVSLAEFDPSQGLLSVAPASADALLTFRNVHNWLVGDAEQRAFELFYTALRPGGVLGVVEHRAIAGTSREAMASSGYMTEAYVVELAERAGFVLEARSEINANPLDDRDHPAGVWTLPPNLRLGERERDTYLAVGESDRMTLRFRKPIAVDDGGY